MFPQFLIAGFFTRTTPIGAIIMGVGVIGISLFGLVTGQCLLVTDLHGFKGRFVSVLGLAVGIAFLAYGINGL